jgi:hypothetical protein
VLVAATPASAAGPRPLFQMPFTCGQEWTGHTRDDHKPNPHSIDFFYNHGSTHGQPVLASAAGVVRAVAFDSRPTGAGWELQISHGGGWGTSYLHLAERPSVSEGQSVALGQQVGRVGNTGTEKAHLHYQQWVDRQANTVQSVFNGVPVDIAIGRSRTLKSHNCGQGTPQGAPSSQGSAVFGGNQYKFARGADGTVKYWYGNGGPWSGTNTVPGSAGTSGDPVAAVFNGNLYVFATATDGTVKYWYGNGGPWSGTNTVTGSAGTSTTGGLSSQVSAGNLYVFATATDGSVKYWYGNGGPWSGTNTVTGSASGPANRTLASAVSGGNLYLFATATDGSVNYWYGNGGPWSGTNTVTGSAGHSTRALSSVVFGGNLYIYAGTTNGAIHYWYGNGGPWSPTNSMP